MTYKGVDYSYSRPDLKALHGMGYRFVMRYLGGSATKDLSASERDAIHAAGLGIGLVYENTGGEAKGGLTAGVRAATAAKAQAESLGWPAHLPIYFAVDFQLTPPFVNPVRGYFMGISRVLPINGPYGGFATISAVGSRWNWQTVAWSGGKVHPRANIFQYQEGVSLAGGTVDLDQSVNTLSFWMPATPIPPVKGKQMETVFYDESDPRKDLYRFFSVGRWYVTHDEWVAMQPYAQAKPLPTNDAFWTLPIVGPGPVPPA